MCNWSHFGVNPIPGIKVETIMLPITTIISSSSTQISVEPYHQSCKCQRKMVQETHTVNHHSKHPSVVKAETMKSGLFIEFFFEQITINTPKDKRWILAKISEKQICLSDKIDRWYDWQINRKNNEFWKNLDPVALKFQSIRENIFMIVRKCTSFSAQNSQ